MATTINDGNLSGNDFGVYVSDQALYGEIDATPEFRKVRRTGGKNSATVGYVESAEIKDNGQGKDQIQDSKKFTLPIETELNKQAVDWFITGMHAVEVPRADTDTVYATTATGLTSTGGEFASYEIGDYFWASGFAATANDTMYRITAKADNDTVTTYPAPASVEAAGASVTITSNKSTNAQSATLFATQTRAPDATAVGGIDHETHYDGFQNSAEITIGESGIGTFSSEILSEKTTGLSTAVTGQTDATVELDRSISSVQDVKEFYIDGLADTAATMKDISISIANNYTEDLAAATEGALLSRGDVQVTGSATVRSPKSNPFVWRNKARNGTRTSIGVLLEHGGTGDQTLITMEKCVITEGDPDASGGAVANSSCSFQAEEAVNGWTVGIFKNW